MHRIDYDRTIFVIDTLTIAFIVSILSKGHRIRCIFEKMDGICSEHAFLMLKNFCSSCMDIKESQDICVPNANFLWRRPGESKFAGVKRLRQFRKKMDEVFQEEKGITYIGPGTSAVMQSLRAPEKNIYYTYHGYGDYIEYYYRTHEKGCVQKKKKMKHRINEKLAHFIVGRLLGLPRNYNAGFFALKGYALYNFRNADVQWVNYMHFSSDKIAGVMEKLSGEVRENSVVFCPISASFTADGLDQDTRKYNDKNIDILKRFIKKGEVIYIKHHYSVYKGSSMVSDLEDTIHRVFGNETHDLVSYVPDEVGGALVPLEVFFRYCDFKKIVSCESSTAFNLESEKIEKYYDTRYYDKEFHKEAFVKMLRIMKRRGTLNSSYHWII